MTIVLLLFRKGGGGICYSEELRMMRFGSQYDEAAQEVASRCPSTYYSLPVDKATSYNLLFITAVAHATGCITDGHRRANARKRRPRTGKGQGYFIFLPLTSSFTDVYCIRTDV